MDYGPIRRVRVVLPSSPIPDQAAFAAGVQWLQAAGVTVVMPEQRAPGPLPHLAGSDQQRAHELADALSEPQIDAAHIDAVWCGRGGSGALRTLSALPSATAACFSPAGRHRPLIGLSDATALLLARLYDRPPGVAIHGPVVTQLAGLDAPSAGALRTWLNNPAVLPEIRAKNPENQGYIPAEGELVAGNLALLASCCGTPEQPRLHGALLLIEEIGEPVYRVDRMMAQLARSGAFHGLRGIALGTFVNCKPDGAVERCLLGWAQHLGVPCLSGLPVGHGAACWPVALGLRYVLSVDEGLLAPLEDVPSWLERTAQSAQSAQSATVPPVQLQTRLTQVALPVLQEALAAGVGSALALGVITSTGERAVCTVGHTRKFRRVDDQLRASVGSPITAQTAFDVASLTKPMVTSTLLAGAVARGDLQLDMRLDAVLPLARGTALGQRTLGSLVNHTSGAIAWHDFYADARHLTPSERPKTIRAAVLAHALRPAVPPELDGRPDTADTPDTADVPGLVYPAVYSDLGFIALGCALEVHYGAPLDQLFARHIAAPLGLSAHYRRLSTAADAPYGSAQAVVATEIWPPRCPHGWPLQGEVHDDNCAGLDGVAGHAGLFASLDDVLTWAGCWLQSACDQPHPLSHPLAQQLPSALVAKWLRSRSKPIDPRFETTWRQGFDTPSGVGSSAGAGVGERAFGHLGFTGTSVWIDPGRRAGRQVAVVFLSNRVHPTRDDHAAIKALRPLLHELVWRVVAAHK